MTGDFLSITGESNMAVIALNVRGVRSGTPFGIERHTVGKGRRRRTYVIYVPYTSINALERAYSTYVNGWLLANVGLVAKFRLLAMAELNLTYGIEILTADRLVELRRALQPLIEGRTDKYPGLSMTTELEHAITLFRITKEREGMRRVLGEASVMANLTLREEDLERVGEMVVTIGMMVAHYIDGVCEVVDEQREELKKVLLMQPAQLFSQETVGTLREVATRLRTTLVARTFTRIGMHAPRDLEKAAGIIERMLDVPESVRAGGSPGVRRLIGAGDNSLLLFNAKHQLEQLITRSANFILKLKEAKANDRELEVDWDGLGKLHRQVVGMIPEWLGEGFEHNVVPETCMLLGEAGALLVKRDLEGFKEKLGEAAKKL